MTNEFDSTISPRKHPELKGNTVRNSAILYKYLATCSARGLRFGQAVDNIFHLIRQDGKDPFYVEDEEMEKYFDQFVRKFA